jgi:hypothetical protein
MSAIKATFACFIVFACLALSMAATTANAVAISYTDSGWWDSTGFSTDLSFSNYVAGTWQCNPPYCDPARPVLTRNFFVFDLDGVGTVTSATLRLSTEASWAGTYSIWDVDTAIPTLRAPGLGNTAVFDDLGSGVSYGSIALTPTAIVDGVIIEIELTAAALASINAKDGCDPAPSVDCLWAIGGSFDPVIPGLFAFGNSGLGVRELVYSTSVPEPTTALLLACGLVALGVRRRRH